VPLSSSPSIFIVKSASPPVSAIEMSAPVLFVIDMVPLAPSVTVRPARALSDCIADAILVTATESLAPISATVIEIPFTENVRASPADMLVIVSMLTWFDAVALRFGTDALTLAAIVSAESPAATATVEVCVVPPWGVVV
jgi:hypothetical protein